MLLTVLNQQVEGVAKVFGLPHLPGEPPGGADATSYSLAAACMRFYIASMRITTHGNDLLITDQSIGLGAALASGGVLLLVSCLEGLISGGSLVLPLLSGLAGALGVKIGLGRLAATQLIIDPDAQQVITRRWSFMGSDVQRIPFDAVKGFDIVPEDRDRGTQLMIETTRGKVPASGGIKAVRSAWQDVIIAIQAHMER